MSKPFAQALLQVLFVRAEVNPWEKGKVESSLTDPAGQAWTLATSEDQQSWTLTHSQAN